MNKLNQRGVSTNDENSRVSFGALWGGTAISLVGADVDGSAKAKRVSRPARPLGSNRAPAAGRAAFTTFIRSQITVVRPVQIAP